MTTMHATTKVDTMLDIETIESNRYLTETDYLDPTQYM